MPIDYKKLTTREHFLRVDVGEYRIIYQLSDEKDTIFVLLIGKRNDDEVYRKFKRKI